MYFLQPHVFVAGLVVIAILIVLVNRRQVSTLGFNRAVVRFARVQLPLWASLCCLLAALADPYVVSRHNSCCELGSAEHHAMELPLQEVDEL